MWDLFQKFTDNSKSIVELLGTGKESRDFIHIDDIIRQIELVIANARFEGEALNIGNGKEISVFHVAKIFQECLNSNKEIKFNNIVREGDPLNWCADIEILADWGYLQKVNLKDGILNYIVHNKNEAFN
jgi:dTDP-glucose 4,6-dehydratase/UDP-glucose 4-epimerase